MMGTRGAIGFRQNGRDKVTYNHFDSYPDCLGVKMLAFAQTLGFGRDPAKYEEVKKKVLGIRLVNEECKPTPEQIELCSKYLNLNVGTQDANDWYCLLRDAQGNLQANLDVGIMIDSYEFLIDSLFCEWAYIINLDDNKLEVYEGFNQGPKAPKAKGRYARFTCDDMRKDNPRERYWGVKLVQEYDLYDLPTQEKFLLDLTFDEE